MKRSVLSFLKIINLHSLQVDKIALNDILMMCDDEDWVLVGTLQRDELRLLSAGMWCSKMSDTIRQESGVIEFCDEAQRELFEDICAQKNNNSVILSSYHSMCNLYLALLLHQRLEVEMSVPLVIYKNFEVRYYQPGILQQAQPVISKLPDFVRN